MNITKKKFMIEGISCASCVASIEKNLEKKQGVEKVSVSIATGKLDIEYFENEVKTKEIIEVVSKLGFQIVGFMMSYPEVICEVPDQHYISNMKKLQKKEVK
ncbi:heavy-metal-associated domain-containing protein [bacterium AH-315-G05]|nr:heavy-metal-associated domain-containing protein [bacterium AH-315-G05]